ncbi:MAG TPA: protein-L-isoaspartate(D-aspartate) O-methyltransferase [Xanthomonadales bacterium]|nr:protein-L-isoaspartate(D-aspartate) O-methyltransferase [Xanthomonadales bacterium]
MKAALILIIVAVTACAGARAQPAGNDPATERADERAALVRELAADFGDRVDRRVLDAIGAVPRHRFVPAARAPAAYENRPLPIGHGQTISQPYIVALMTDVLEPRSGMRVLEIGTGSGYQAAILAGLVEHVDTIEIVAPLATQAKRRLAALGYGNVEVRQGDGYYGWPGRGPYDAIIVTAAAGSIPPPLIAQLKPGGRMVIPVGAPFLTQTLVLVEKHADGKVRTRQLVPVRFVPLTGGH